MKGRTMSTMATLLATAAMCLVGSAHAAGLMAQKVDDMQSVPEEGSAAEEVLKDPSLLRLESLEVSAAMNEATAQVTEKRVYLLDQASGFGDFGFFNSFEPVEVEATVTFFRSIEHLDGADVLEFRVDGEPRFGHVLDADEADALRRDLVNTLQDPAPLGEMGRRLFVSDPVSVTLSPWYGVQVEFTLTQPTDAHGSMRGIEVPVDWNKQPVQSMNVHVDVTTDGPVRALYGPFHHLDVQRHSKHSVEGSYSGWDRCTSFPVTILLSTGDEPIHVDLLPFRYEAEEGGHFLALITPDDTPPAEDVIGRDIVLVVDRSGSMEGEKMVQAQSALKGVLAGLREEDSFNVVAFDEVIESFGSNATPATADNVQEASDFVDGLWAEGPTNIYDALTTAFASLPVQTGHPRYVVLLTDGQPTAGETNTDAILSMAKIHNEIGARIFTFGIGYDVNTVLLDKLAMDSAGDALYIKPGQDVDAAVSSFFDQIVDPVLTDPVVDAEEFGVTGLYPEVLTDLFAGQTTVVLGRYNKPGDAQLVITGRSGDEDVVHTFDVSLPAYSIEEGYVPRIWATRHVGSMLQDLKLGGDDQGLIDEVLKVANRYGVVTEFTYFEVDEAGDAHMAYSPVPVAASGVVAVNTSSSIDGYQKGGTVNESVDTYVRYAWDRTLPTVSGWFTDTSLPATADWVDIHFGSEQHFALATDEAHLGIGDFLAVGRNVRFEHLGRSFRITDPAEPAGDELPAATYAVPEPATQMESGPATVSYVTDEPSTGGGSIVIFDDGSGPVELPTDEKPQILPAPSNGQGCQVTTGGNGWAQGLPWILACAALMFRMRRRILDGAARV